MKDILISLKPTIKLDVMDAFDNDSAASGLYKNSESIGSITPHIRINGMDFFGSSISSFRLSVGDIVPYITFTIKEKMGAFLMKFYPRKGDLVSVMIKSNNPDFKSIRQDYRIISIPEGSYSNTDFKAKYGFFTINAVLNIPGFYGDKTASFYNMTSFETLMEICKELGLGLATNELQYNDRMTRICPSIPYYKFIQTDILSNAYKNENSFFSCYVDQYYMMNLVEVNSMIVVDGELDDTTVNYLIDKNYYSGPSTQDLVVADKFYLSNAPRLSGTTNHIYRFSPINKSGAVDLLNGNRAYICYYNLDSERVEEYYIEPAYTNNATNEYMTDVRGRVGDEELYTKTSYEGVKTTNDHQNAMLAKIQNAINANELDKLCLSVKTRSVNNSIYLYQSIPVYIIQDDDVFRDEFLDGKGKSNSGNGSNDDPQVNSFVNKFLSGFYVCKNIEYEYDGLNFNTGCLLAKRDFYTDVKDEQKSETKKEPVVNTSRDVGQPVIKPPVEKMLDKIPGEQAKSAKQNVKGLFASKNCRKLIERYEGRKYMAYRDAGGYSIGVGHFIKPGEERLYVAKITDAEVDKLFDGDIRIAENEIKSRIKVDISQNQFDSMVSFVFNVGVGNFSTSTLLRLINQGAADSVVANEFDKWIYSEGKVVSSLVSRRESEKSVFMS